MQRRPKVLHLGSLTPSVRQRNVLEFNARSVANAPAELPILRFSQTSVRESTFTLRPGQAAVIAEVSEDWTTPVNTAAARLGGTVYRRTRKEVRDASFFGDDYADYLYPYDYKPYFSRS